MHEDGSVLIGVDVDVKDADKRVAELKKRISLLERELDAASAAGLKRDAQAISNQLKAAVDEAGALQYEINASASGIYDVGTATDLAEAKMEAFAGNMEKSLDASRSMSKVFGTAFIASAVINGVKVLAGWMGEIVKANGEASKAVGRLKAALLTLAQPLVDFIIPAFIDLVDILSSLVDAASNIVSYIFGTTAEESAKAAEALNGEIEALEGTGKAADKAGKALASFDEINKLSSNTSVTSTGNASGEISPDFKSLSGTIRDEISEMLLYLSSASLAIGAVLAFSGANVGLGIGLMAAGALGLASTALNWDALPQELKNTVAKVVSVLTAGSLAVGAILALSGISIPVGIGLMALGAVSLASASALNWNAMENPVKSALGKVGAILGASLLAVGAILALSNVNLPIGIALIAMGSASLASAASMNWNKIPDGIKGAVSALAGAIGASLLVLGAILLFTGAGVPLGLGLIAAGGASLATAIAPNWGWLKNEIANTWASIKRFWQMNIAPVFTTEFWADKFQSIVDGLKQKLAEALAALQSFFAKLGAEQAALSQRAALSSVSASSISAAPSVYSYSIPRLATGAVIPPNREFMAVLGDQKSGNNIEAPESLIRRIVREETAGGNGDVTVILEMDKVQFGKAVFKLNKEESRRIGARLVTT